MEDYMLPCMNKTIFGVDCMGCGTQRALHLLLQGEFVEAYKMFPAIYTLILFAIVLFLHFIDKKRNYLKLISLLAIVNGVLMIINYFYKINFN